MTFLLVALAAAAGLLGNRRLGRTDPVAEGGFGIQDLVAPVTTLAVMLMAFVMGQSLASYSRAQLNIATEARIVNEMSESAGRLDDRSS